MKANITETHPELAREWHPTKNGLLNPEQWTDQPLEIGQSACKENQCECSALHIANRRILDGRFFKQELVF